MDRLIHTVGSGLTIGNDRLRITAQNLANLSVPGYRRDIAGEGGTVFLNPAEAEGTASRAFPMPAARHGFSQEPGQIEQTGDPLDVAIPDAGFLYVQPASGEPALSRRGDLRLDAERRLVNGAGELMLDAGLGPIVVPPYRDIMIDDTGRITISPADGPPGERAEIATLATVIPTDPLQKGDDGQIRRPDGTLPDPDQQARLTQGALERSNVNATTELIASIDQQRGFELKMRMISEAKTLDEAGGRLLRLAEG